MDHRISHIHSALGGLVLGVFIGWGIAKLNVRHDDPLTAKEAVKFEHETRLSLSPQRHQGLDASPLPPSPTGDSTGETSEISWQIKAELSSDLQEKLEALRKRLQKAEAARATFTTKETAETSSVRVEIKSATKAEAEGHWRYVRDVMNHLSPELRSFYEVDARRLMERFLAFPKKHRVLVVTSHDPGTGEQLVHFVFNTDEPHKFTLQEDASIATPDSVELLNYITPWIDPQTYAPSERYGYLVKFR